MHGWSVTKKIQRRVPWLLLPQCCFICSHSIHTHHTHTPQCPASGSGKSSHTASRTGEHNFCLWCLSSLTHPFLNYSPFSTGPTMWYPDARALREGHHLRWQPWTQMFCLATPQHAADFFLAFSQLDRLPPSEIPDRSPRESPVHLPWMRHILLLLQITTGLHLSSFGFPSKHPYI